MSDIEIILNKNSDRQLKTFGEKLKEKLYTNRFYVFLFFLAAAIIASFLVFSFGTVGGVLFIAAIITLPFVYAIIVYPSIGIVVLLVLSYFLMFIARYVSNVPMGTSIDGLEVLLFIGFFLKIKQAKNWELLKGPVSTMVLVWIAYNLVEVCNPSASSILAWVYTVRSVAIMMFLYFVFVYNIRTVSFVRLILKIWIALSVVAALYALKQEFIGFSAVEEEYLYSDPLIASLLFINGEWRKYSIFTDPVTFSYNMAVSALLCLALITGPVSAVKKIILAGLAALFLYVMIFSGTRGAYVLVPVSMILFAILKYSRKLVMAVSIGAVLFILLIFVPTSNASLYRFQSAFKPSDDASYNLRKENQRRIKPYILTHPMGGGLGSTGVWGVKFAPNSYLASFPPDSGYVRVAVEMGWIGLFLFCLLMFTILKTGVNNFYRIKDPELKSYCLAMTLIVFAFNIGNFPQEALVQFPSNIYFYLVAALITVTCKLDREKQSSLKNHASVTLKN